MLKALIHRFIVSFKKNIIANYVSQLYMAGLGVLILPLYIKYMGAEAYGLIGFFTMLQAWFALLDLGLTPTIGRETARYRGGSMSALQFRQLFRALSVIFFSIALIGGLLLWIMAEPIAFSWLTFEELQKEDVVLAVEIMAVSVAMRWMTGLYRGVVTGSERLVWISSLNIIVATFRFIGVFVSMYFYGFTVEVFFYHQLCVAMVELIVLYWISDLLIPKRQTLHAQIGWSLKPIKSLLKFSLSVALTSSIWIMVTQVDKLVLSGILPLEEYGFFTLAVMLAAGILTLSIPVSSAIMPRMARLYAEGKEEEMIHVYRSTTQLVSVIAGSAAIFIAIYSERLLYVWTGDLEIAKNASPVLQLYAMGYGVLAVAAFPYYLQYALGNLRYHLIGNLITLFTLLPVMVWAAKSYGAIGAGWAWFIVHSTYLLLWVGFVHGQLVPKLNMKWLFQDVVKIYFPTAIVGWIVSHLIYLGGDRVDLLISLLLCGLLMIFTGTLFSEAVRKLFMRRFSRNE